MEKCIWGYLISGVILALLVGPLYFFSDAGNFIQTNPVQTGTLSLDFVIQRELSDSEMMHLAIDPNSSSSIDLNLLTLNEEPVTQQDLVELAQDHSKDSSQGKVQRKLRQKVPYNIFKDRHPFLRQYNDEYYYNHTLYSKWTETRFFKPD